VTGWEKGSALKHKGQRNALPFADGAPSLDAVMARDLGPLRHPPQILKRQIQWFVDQPIDTQPPISKTAFPQGRIFVALRLPFTLKTGDTSAAVNSRASACPPPSSRWVR
jgi:hypothetical protein